MEDLAPLLSLGLFLVASPVLGQVPVIGQVPVPAQPVRLEYERGNLAGCPEERFFRVFVAARFGGDNPFPARAGRRIKLTLLRRPRADGRNFAADVAMYDQAGARLGGDELAEADCTSLVESAGLLVVSWLVPLSGPALDREHAEPAPPPAPALSSQSQPDAPAPRALAVPGPPAVAPRAGIFEGKVGVSRAVLYGLTAGGLAVGSVFVLAAGDGINGARQLSAGLDGKGGLSACSTARSAACRQVGDLAQQHDTYTDLAIGSFVAAGVVGSAVTASIWLVRVRAAPGHDGAAGGSQSRAAAEPVVQITPTAARRGGGITLQGSW